MKNENSQFKDKNCVEIASIIFNNLCIGIIHLANTIISYTYKPFIIIFNIWFIAELINSCLHDSNTDGWTFLLAIFVFLPLVNAIAICIVNGIRNLSIDFIEFLNNFY